MGLAGVGTPEQSFGVTCAVQPNNKRDLHGTSWLAKPRKPLKPVGDVSAPTISATCYNYNMQQNDSVASLIETFQLDVRSFIQQNQRQFGGLQAVTFKLGESQDAAELERILRVVGSVTRPLTADPPYFT